MSTVTSSIHIAASPQDVWETVMDPKRLGEWVTIHRSLLHAGQGTPRVGYEMDQQIHLRGVSLDVHWRLVECRPGELAVWEGRGPARSRAHTEYVLRAEGTGTRFDYRNEFRAPLGPVGALASRTLVGGIPAREATRTLERLRALLESKPGNSAISPA
jgi:carbon monoxide dehydrogenase subunit G